MDNETLPPVDPAAAARWTRVAPDRSPWLHEEVGRRMAQRLEWIRLRPTAWADWNPVLGGVQAHADVERRYPKAQRYLVVPGPRDAGAARALLGGRWWQPRRWLGGTVHLDVPPDGAVQMVWANMLLHQAARPRDLMQQWLRALAPQGFVMFSALGPDSLRELRGLWQELGLPPPAQAFTDMHDWGDMLAESGFAEPVMDMETITLRYSSAVTLLAELRGLGRNLHPDRFGALRGRGWRDRMAAQIESRAGDGPTLTFEVVHGHAFRPAAMTRVKPRTEIGLDEMRRMLRESRSSGAQT